MSERARERRLAVLRHLGTFLFLAMVFTSFGGCSGCCCDGCSCHCSPCPGPPDASVTPPPPSRPPSSCSCSHIDYQWDAGPIDAPLDTRTDAPFTTFDVPRDACDYTTPGAAPGSVCRPDGSCADGLTCELGVLVPVLAGEPRLIPTNVCAIACDPARDDCGPCARCSSDLPVGAGRLTAPPVCRPRCTPSLLDRGDCLAGFTCDPRTAVCVPACQTDLDCQLEPTADGLAFTEQPLLTCDPLTGRCAHPDPTPAPPLGTACETDLDCAATDVCFRPSFARLGACARFGCASPSLACDLGAVCTSEGCVPQCLAIGPACPLGLACERPSGTCRLTCTTSAECAAGRICQTELGCTGDCFCVSP